ncbi:lamin tail domain-containing protein [Candidatus Woesearchaeota archaeon]|nr:lamin tail domain-containing protein [Candidatus Woesearchaeota archaeon]
MVRFSLTFLLFFFILAANSSANLDINEVMYAPSTVLGSENEWIELYSSGNTSLNLSNCTLDGKAIPKTIIDGNSYLILANNLGLFNTSYHDIPAIKLSLNLNNDQDTILLKCQWNETFSEEKRFSYEQQQGAYRNNFTLERRSDNTWSESIEELGTPGRENSIFDFASNFRDLKISEILPDPFWEDDLLKPEGEWVELYNGGKKTMYLKGLILKDGSDDHELYVVESKIINSAGLFLQPKNYVTIYRDGDTDFALNNEGMETVRLFYGDELLDEVSYSGSTSGMSWSNIKETFYLTPPTPDRVNQISEGCDWLLLMNSSSSIFHSADFTFDVYVSRFIGLPRNVTVRGKIEDAFGETIKEYSPWTNVLIDDERGVSYSPNLAEGIYQITFWIDELGCNDTDEMDNSVSRIFSINSQYQVFQPSLAIQDLYLGSDESAAWGEQFLVKVNAYKGNSTKTSLELWAEQDGEIVSERSKVNLYDKFQNITLSLPLQLEARCNGDDDALDLIFSGLGLEVKEEFKVEGVEASLCDQEASSEPSSGSKTKEKQPAFQILDLPQITSVGAILPLKIQLKNNEKESLSYELWAYVYQGNKCYSCGNAATEREANKKIINLKNGETKQLTLYSKLDDTLKPGEYKIKVKMKREGQKTEKELTETIYLLEEQESSLGISSLAGGDEEFPSNSSEARRTSTSSVQETNTAGIVVYQSSSAKSLTVLPYIFIISLILIGIVLIIHR